MSLPLLQKTRKSDRISFCLELTFHSILRRSTSTLHHQLSQRGMIRWIEFFLLNGVNNYFVSNQIESQPLGDIFPKSTTKFKKWYFLTLGTMCAMRAHQLNNRFCLPRQKTDESVGMAVIGCACQPERGLTFNNFIVIENDSHTKRCRVDKQAPRSWKAQTH